MNNYNSGQYGNVYSSYSYNQTYKNMTFKNNYCKYAGGLYIYESQPNSILLFENNTIEENQG